jgi:hypothetical protein
MANVDSPERTEGEGGGALSDVRLEMWDVRLDET